MKRQNAMGQIIVGGGPIGLFLASKLKESVLLDKKPKIGIPTRCTGILTDDINKFIKQKDIKKVLKNKITKIEIKGPNKSLEINIKPNYIICNQTFEEMLAEKATNNSCEIKTSTKYLKSDEKGHHIKNIKTGKSEILKSDKLIGCDGPLSEVSKQHNLDKHKLNYIGHQVTIKVKKEHENKIVFFPHIGHYAWYVPESEKTARVGVCTNIKGGRAVFDGFLKKFPGKVISNQSGIIPTFQPKRKTYLKTKHHEVTLIGDSAGHIKNTTGGGIIPGFKAAQHYFENHDNNTQNKELRRELYAHFLVHNLVSKCNNKEWDQIIEATEKNKAVLEEINRDNLKAIARKVLFDKTYLKIGIKKIMSGKVKLR